MQIVSDDLIVQTFYNIFLFFSVYRSFCTKLMCFFVVKFLGLSVTCTVQVQ